MQDTTTHIITNNIFIFNVVLGLKCFIIHEWPMFYASLISLYALTHLRILQSKLWMILRLSVKRAMRCNFAFLQTSFLRL